MTAQSHASTRAQEGGLDCTHMDFTSGSMPDTTEVLLSFLADVGTDYSSSFFFPDDVLMEDVDLAEFLHGSRGVSMNGENKLISPNSVTHTASNVACTPTNVDAATPIEEEVFFDQVLGAIDWDINEECFEEQLEVIYSSFPPPSPSDSERTIDSEHTCSPINLKKRKQLESEFDEHMHVHIHNHNYSSNMHSYRAILSPRIPLKQKTTFLTHKQLKKKYKQSPGEKVKCVVRMLRKMVYRDEEEECEDSDREPRRDLRRNIDQFSGIPPLPPKPSLDPLEQAQKLLSLLLSSKQTTVLDFRTICSPSMMLMSRPLSSLHEEIRWARTQMHLSAWSVPRENSVIDFPEVHHGIGQVSAAARSFLSLMSDLLSPSLVQHIHFDASVSPEGKKNVIVTARGDHLTAPFTWKSDGMRAMGFPEELEFNGLIRCSFGKDGISKCTVSYDGCTIVRAFHNMREKATISPSALEAVGEVNQSDQAIKIKAVREMSPSAVFADKFMSLSSLSSVSSRFVSTPSPSRMSSTFVLENRSI